MSMVPKHMASVKESGSIVCDSCLMLGFLPHKMAGWLTGWTAWWTDYTDRYVTNMDQKHILHFFFQCSDYTDHYVIYMDQKHIPHFFFQCSDYTDHYVIYMDQKHIPHFFFQCSDYTDHYVIYMDQKHIPHFFFQCSDYTDHYVIYMDQKHIPHFFFQCSNLKTSTRCNINNLEMIYYTKVPKCTTRQVYSTEREAGGELWKEGNRSKHFFVLLHKMETSSIPQIPPPPTPSPALALQVPIDGSRDQITAILMFP